MSQSTRKESRIRNFGLDVGTMTYQKTRTMPNTFKEALMAATIIDPENAKHILALIRAEHAPALVDEGEETVEWESQDENVGL